MKTLIVALMSLGLFSAVVPAQAGFSIKDVPQSEGPGFGPADVKGFDGPAIGPELTSVDGPGR